MSPEPQIDRSVLAGKDRDELHTIAGAVGVKAATRMRKADLIDAILAATGAAPPPSVDGNGASGAAHASAADAAAPAVSDGNGAASNGADGGDDARPRRVRSVRASQLAAADDLATLAAEEDALGGDVPDDLAALPAPRPARRETGAPAATTTEVVAAPPEPSATTQAPAPSAPSNGDDTAPGGGPRTDEFEDERQSFGDGNRRSRRRRRGRGGQEFVPEQRHVEYQGEPVAVQGLLDLRDEGYGFLRASGFLPGPRDVYVSASQVRRFALRKGDFVKGSSRPQASNEKYPALLRVDEINGMTPDDARSRAKFEDLTPLFPDSKLRLELAENPHEITGRIVDLISPIGKGQRGLIVSPPKAGKTTILKQLVYSIERNNPEVHLMVLLVDERPEEVTDMRRHVVRGEVVASTFDRPADEHTQVAELAIERAKRLVEMGTDVVIVLDGITRLARAYNLSAPTSGRIMSGGVDSTALYPPKKFFGAARNIEEGGSLTIIATALIETGSRMDEVIFEEFKGTGNMELRLDRRLSERRIYPSIDVEASSTRHEELLFDRQGLQQVWKLRRVLNALEEGKGLELLIDKIRTTRSNDEFLAEIAKTPGGY
jgi:transcription termination factor Rho